MRACAANLLTMGQRLICQAHRLQAQIALAPRRVCALLDNIPQLRIASIKIFVMKHEFRPRCSPAWSAAGASLLAPRGATLRITLIGADLCQQIAGTHAVVRLWWARPARRAACPNCGNFACERAFS